MNLQLSNLHLYLSKESSVRTQVKEVILPKLSLIDTDNLELPILDSYIDEFLDSPEVSEYERQTKYTIIDYLLVEFYDHEKFDLVVQYLLDKFRSYIVIHELAALSWGDKLLPPGTIFEILEGSDLSQKHCYHILNEMSVTYPEETLEFVIEAVSRNLIDQGVKEKVEKKMLKDRREGKVLSKGIIPQLSRKEIQSLIN